MDFKYKKILGYTLIILLILDIPFILYLFNFNSFVFNRNFYKKEFEKYDLYTELKNYDIEKVNKDVLDYFKNKDILIKNDFFNEREKEHLKDVKDLIQLILFIFYFSIILFFVLSILLILSNKNNIKSIIKNAGIIFLFSGFLTFLDAFIFWLMLKLNFDLAFELMHKIFFRIGTYVFDPSFENIVVLYPPQFFYDITINIVVNTLAFSFFLFLGGLFIIVYFNK
jgi:integral membrane protein (TIGR01906 family)